MQRSWQPQKRSAHACRARSPALYLSYNETMYHYRLGRVHPTKYISGDPAALDAHREQERGQWVAESEQSCTAM